MKQIQYIYQHPLYQSSYRRLEELEKDRIFCCHQMDHLISVARIAYIRSLEEKLLIPKPVIYASALLHDIGKHRQYEDGIPHEQASTKIAEKILGDMPEHLRFDEQQTRQILTAILGHRHLRQDAEPLEALLYESDKASRLCYACPAEAQCSWNDSKKNREIRL